MAVLAKKLVSFDKLQFLNETLGSGNFGTVLKAEYNNGVGIETVAVKKIKQELRTDASR